MFGEVPPDGNSLGIYPILKPLMLGVDSLQPIPSGHVALPKEYRDKAPTTTSYVMDGFDNYDSLLNAVADILSDLRPYTDIVMLCITAFDNTRCDNTIH